MEKKDGGLMKLTCFSSPLCLGSRSGIEISEICFSSEGSERRWLVTLIEAPSRLARCEVIDNGSSGTQWCLRMESNRLQWEKEVFSAMLDGGVVEV